LPPCREARSWPSTKDAGIREEARNECSASWFASVAHARDRATRRTTATRRGLLASQTKPIEQPPAGSRSVRASASSAWPSWVGLGATGIGGFGLGFRRGQWRGRLACFAPVAGAAARRGSTPRATSPKPAQLGKWSSWGSVLGFRLARNPGGSRFQFWVGALSAPALAARGRPPFHGRPGGGSQKPIDSGGRPLFFEGGFSVSPLVAGVGCRGSGPELALGAHPT